MLLQVCSSSSNWALVQAISRANADPVHWPNIPITKPQSLKTKKYTNISFNHYIPHEMPIIPIKYLLEYFLDQFKQIQHLWRICTITIPVSACQPVFHTPLARCYSQNSGCTFSPFHVTCGTGLLSPVWPHRASKISQRWLGKCCSQLYRYAHISWWWDPMGGFAGLLAMHVESPQVRLALIHSVAVRCSCDISCVLISE